MSEYVIHNSLTISIFHSYFCFSKNEPIFIINHWFEVGKLEDLIWLWITFRNTRYLIIRTNNLKSGVHSIIKNKYLLQTKIQSFYIFISSFVCCFQISGQ